MSEKPLKVFLDANVIVRAGKPPGGPLMSRVEDLVKGGFITVLTTDLTKMEVAKKHANNDFEVVGDIGRSHFRKVVEDVTGVHLPNLKKPEVQRKLFEKYSGQTDKMFVRLAPKTLSINSVTPISVFEAYTHKTGLFSGEGKKDQFSDAFIFECLKYEATETEPIVLVSDDHDFDAPCKAAKYISVVKSIPDLFTKLGLKVDAPEIEEFLQEQHGEVVELVNSELNDWGLQVSDVEGAEVDEVTVNDIEFLKLISFGKADGSNKILVVGRLKIQANICYSHPDWDTASYDSEDKVLIPWNDPVSGDKDVEIEADFSMSIVTDDRGKPNQIEEVRFTDDKFIWVDIGDNPYDYK
ncbi:MAG TPA: PIN domain-containing protein [Methylocella sp.]|nr:PIN domain-containing protein [Methylocella sp.]